MKYSILEILNMDVCGSTQNNEKTKTGHYILTYKENCYKNQQQNKVISIGTTSKP